MSHMKVTIIFPDQPKELASNMIQMVPMVSTYLAALTPQDIEVEIIDMVAGDKVNFDNNADAVAITTRTPMADVAYHLADEFRQRGKKVFLGGPHVTIFPLEAAQHADAVGIGEADETWPIMLEDFQKNRLKKFYVSGPFDISSLHGGAFYHDKKRPQLKGLPIPKRDLVPRKRYMFDSLFTTRGCPNNCKFCPVTRLFGSAIRHRPIDEVVADVETLRKRYFNVDDSVFGHPQLTDRPEENRYYLDLYTELANIRPKRYWGGAGGLSAVNYKDGRKILEKAADSGLSSLAAGIESISPEGQKQSGAFRKLHESDPERFTLDKIRENIKIIQYHGIEIMGFFIIGWDNDTIDTYYRTLDFCLETHIMPLIMTLAPMPGSSIYDQFKKQGKILEGITWGDYSGSRVILKHPAMTIEEMEHASQEVIHRGYTLRHILKRSIHAFSRRPGTETFMGSFFTQLGIKKFFSN